MKHEEFHALLMKAIDIRFDIEELNDDIDGYWKYEDNEKLSQSLDMLNERLYDLSNLAEEIESDFDEIFNNWKEYNA